MTLSVTRAKDREKMAQAVEALCAEYGATFKRDTPLSVCPRAIWCKIEMGGMRVTISLDGDSAQDRKGLFCMPWCISLDRRGAQMSDAFTCAVGGSSSYPHHHKCTAFACDFENLLQRIGNGFMVIKAGRAFR